MVAPKSAEAAAPLPPWTEGWEAFCARVESRLAQLASELSAYWEEQASSLDQALAAREAPPPAAEPPPGPAAFIQARRESALRLLSEPLAHWERRRPYDRALQAIQACDRSLEELLKTVPERVEASGAEIFALVGPEVAGSARGLLLGLRKERRSLAIREILGRRIERLKLARLPSEHRYCRVHARAAQELGRAWEPVREAIDAAARGAALAPAEIAAALEGARARADALLHDGRVAVAEWEEWPRRTVRALASGLAGVALRHPAPPRRKAALRRDAHLRAWAGRWRALEAGLRLELALEASETRIAGLFERALEGLAAEQSAVLDELDSLAHWLTRRLQSGGSGEPPAPRAEIVPASARTAEMEAGLLAELAVLPQSCEVLGARLERRSLRPRDKLYDSFRRNGRPELGAIFETAEAEHRKFLQEIGRAREVAAFGLQSGEAGQLEREALENALALLEFYRGQPSDWRAAAGPRLTATLGAVFGEARYQLNRRLGSAALMARHGFRRAWPLVARGAAEALDHSAEEAREAASRLGLRFLVAIGWRSAPGTGWSEVVTRPFLPPEFRLDGGGRRLPALYRHLFRLEPVEDPRFLVGREREMAAIAEARSFWEAGRPASLLIVGERGSGKTSLVNCALKQRLHDVEVIRGEFQDRLTTASEMREFLARLFQTENARLEAFLLERPRVVVLEELERTFLRRIGCFDALRALQRLVAATCPRALWILSTNSVAFRFMDAAVQLGAGFSHRINAATASRDDLRRAILGRHGLSGLRIEFAAPPPHGRMPAWADRLVHGEPDREAAFFDALSRESSGVFRTAFDIWLGYAEGVEAGLLYMKPLDPPDLSPVIDDLDSANLFTLAAILQHGSLTVEEHAAVFHLSPPVSRARIDELSAREIVERDPGRPGFRVRPKATRVVKEALYRRNLL